MTDFPTTDPRVARDALHAAEGDWVAHVEANAETYREAIIDAAEGHPSVVAVLDLHAVEVDTAATRPVTCQGCVDLSEPYYDRGPATWPCPTVRAVTEHLPATGNVPTIPAYPTWSDFYREPDVTITAAHPFKVGDNRYMPRDEVTLPLSEATRLRVRMTPDSWAAVQRLAEDQRRR